MHVEEQQLKAFLLDSDLIDKKRLLQAQKQAKEKNKPLTEILLKQKLISQGDLTKLYAYILGIPFINLEKQKIPIEVLRIIPEEIARAHNIIAFKKEDKELEVAMLNPEDLQTIEFIKKTTDLKILPRLTTEKSIKHLIHQYQKTLESEIKELTPAGLKIIKEKSEKKPKNLEKIAQDLPIIKIVDTLLKHAILRGASDIHIEPQEKEVDIRYRIDGILRPVMVLPKNVLSGIVARIKVLANLKLDEHRLPQDGRFKVETEDYKISFRVSVLKIMNGEKIVMRLLSEQARGLTLEKLGFERKALKIVQRNILKPHGMILITGPTGSGKTTTLYTILDILNKPGVNITTIEDPIEYRMPRINQTQVKPKIGFTFANGLRSLLRQDPDIIMVGEIRDNETANIAVNAAMTGHLILSTLHTNDAVTALPRLADMKVERFLVASTVNLIIAQRLARKLCPDSIAKKYKLTQKEIRNLNKEFDLEKILNVLKSKKIIKPHAQWSNIEFLKPVKCDKCQDGYKGRTGIYEVLEITDKIRDLINQKALCDQIMKQAVKNGMVTLLQHGFIKAVQGLTSIDEILRVSQE